jgi:citrate synthase
MMRRVPKTATPMEVLRTAVSALSFYDSEAEKIDHEANVRKSIRLTSQIAMIVAGYDRIRKGKNIVDPDPTISHAANFLLQLNGEKPSPTAEKALDVALILHADHELNASTFAARVTAATLSDMHSAIVSAIGALKGPLHGGANEAVMETMDEIGTPDSAAQWLEKALAEGRKIMGFGHRVYTRGDSRVPAMRAALGEIAGLRDGQNLVEIYEILAKGVYDAKGLYPNVDYPAGPAYHLIGFDTATFTPIFVAARVTGWTAHIAEQLASNKIIRPLAAYTGPAERHLAG